MLLELGKEYRLRDGSTVGPMTECRVPNYPFRVEGIGCWRENGAYSAHGPHERDVVAEASSPVTVITHTTITPGSYGIITLLDSAMHGKVHIGGNPCHAGPDELREAARIFTEIADAIDAGAST